MTLSNRQKGLLFGIVAPLLYAIRSSILKAAPSNHLETFLFSRVFFDFLILSPFFIRARKEFTFQRAPVHFTRGIFAVIAMFCSIYGMKHLYLADAILLESMIPLFVPLHCFLWYREKISFFALLALIMGFFSIFLILNPQFELFCLGALAPLGTACFTAITSLQVRALAATESPIAILFYYYVFSGVFAGVPLCLNWQGFPSTTLLGYLIAISVFGVLFQFVNTRAYSLLPPHIAGSFSYFSVFFGTLFGVVVFSEPVSLLQILGGCLLCCSGILLLFTGRRRVRLPS